MKNRNLNYTCRRRFQLTAISVVLFVLACHRVVSAEFDDEVRFASGLLELKLPHYATKVIAQIEKNFPDREIDLAPVKAELFIVQGKFDLAEERVLAIPANTLPGQEARLKLGNYYYAANEVEKAKTLYEGYFRQYKAIVPTEPNRLKAYRDAAYALTIMLGEAGDYLGAIESADRVLRTKPDADKRRLVQKLKAKNLIGLAQTDEKHVQKRIEEVNRLASDLEFGGRAWVAEAQVLRAYGAHVIGKDQQAMSLLEGAKSILKETDKSYKDAGYRDQSPRAGAYFVRGLISKKKGTEMALAATDEAAEKAAKRELSAALSQFERIKRTYAAGEYGTDAIVAFNDIMTFLGERGWSTKGQTANMPTRVTREQAAKMFRIADQLFKKGDYQPAIDKYVDVLNKIPETRSSPSALANLAKAYSEVGDEWASMAVVEYLAERFRQDEIAAKQCISIGNYFKKQDNTERFLHAYDTFVKNFPHHDLAPTVLTLLAKYSLEHQNETLAMKYQESLLRDYKGSAQYIRALRQTAKGLFDAKKYGEAAAAYDELVEAMPPSYERAGDMAMSATCALLQEKYMQALRGFKTIVEALDTKDRSNNPYYGDSTHAASVQTLLEQAQLQLAYCISRLTKPKADVPKYQVLAAKTYEEFKAKFPKSELMPKALMGQAKVYLAQDKIEQATTLFEELSERFPNSPEGKNSLVSLISSALDVGKIDIARGAVQKVVAEPDRYSSKDLALIGRKMLDGGLYSEAISLYETVRAGSQDPEVREFALYGLGESYIANGDCVKGSEALESLQKVLKEKDSTWRFFDIKFLMVRAYRDCQDFGKANGAISDIVKLTRDRVTKKRADLELAKTMEAADDKKHAYSSYQLIALHPNPSGDPELKEFVRVALLRCMELGLEAGDFDAVIDYGETFLTHYADDQNLSRVKRMVGQAKLKRAQGVPVAAE